MRTLQRHLDSMFGTRHNRKRNSGSYLAVQGNVSAVIERREDLWTTTIEGRTYRNSKLGDLKLQLEGLGYTVSRDRSR